MKKLLLCGILLFAVAAAASAASVEAVSEDFDTGDYVNKLYIDTGTAGETPQRTTAGTGFTFGGMAIGGDGELWAHKGSYMLIKNTDPNSYYYTIFDSSGGNTADTTVNLINGKIESQMSIKDDDPEGFTFRYMVRNGAGNWYVSDTNFTAVSSDKTWFKLETEYGADRWTEITNTVSLDALAGGDEVELTLGSSGLTPSLYAVDGLGIYVESAVGGTGTKMLCHEMKIKTGGFRGCMPEDDPDYIEWLSVGMPESWCYPRHCHGDADSVKHLVELEDFAVLADAWLVENPTVEQLAGDFDHSSEMFGGDAYRVGFDDLDIFVSNWLTSPAMDCIASQWQSDLVYYDSNGLLVYEAEPYSNEHHIPDFSHAGYMGGGVPIPDVPTVLTISPVEGRDTDNIQDAIDMVCAMSPDGNGIRGALLIEAGIYDINAPIVVNASGVVLRGQGDGNDPATDTIIYRVQENYGGDYSDAVITFAGTEDADTKFNEHVDGSYDVDITTQYVPVGARSFEVANASQFNAGDRVTIIHPDTWDWLESVDYGGGSANWEPGDIKICFNRYVAGKNGNTITLDAPVFVDIDRSLTQAYIYPYEPAGRLSKVGLEDIRVDMATSGLDTEEHAQHAVEFHKVDDSWALRSTTLKASFSGFYLHSATRCTIEDCKALQPHSDIDHTYGFGGGRNYNFRIEIGQLLLFKDCLAVYARHAYVGNGEGRDNGLVFLNCRSEDAFFSSEGHRQWCNGFLFDGHTEDSLSGNNHLSFQRGGSGHGWNTVHSVMWNCQMLNGGIMVVQRPPSAQNYNIGGLGMVTGDGAWQNGPDGYIEGNNDEGLWPHSLYEAQLSERLNNP